MASTNRSLTRFQLREIVKEAKSSATENKAPAALFVFTPAGQLGFLSTVMKDGVMTGIGGVTTPSPVALKQFLFRYLKRVYITQMLHLKVIVDIFAVKNGSWSVGNTLTAAMEACLPSLLVLYSDEILKEVAVSVSHSS